MFIEEGVDNTSIEQVAKRAGVTRLTVYRRWATKEELLVQAIESARETVPDLAVFARVESDPATPEERIELLIGMWADAVTDGRIAKLLARLIGAAQSHPSLLAAYWETYLRPRREVGRRALRYCVDIGLLPADADLDVLTDMLAGTMIYRLLMYPGAPPTRDEFREYQLAVLRQAGFRLPPTS